MPVPEPHRFTLDSPVAPSRILAGEAQHEVLDRRCGGWPTGVPARAVVPHRGDETAVPAEQGAWADREDVAPVAPRYEAGEGSEPESIGRLVAERAGQLADAAPRPRAAAREVPRLSRQHRAGTEGRESNFRVIQQGHDHRDMLPADEPSPLPPATMAFRAAQDFPEQDRSPGARVPGLSGFTDRDHVRLGEFTRYYAVVSHAF